MISNPFYLRPLLSFRSELKKLVPPLRWNKKRERQRDEEKLMLNCYNLLQSYVIVWPIFSMQLLYFESRKDLKVIQPHYEASISAAARSSSEGFTDEKNNKKKIFASPKVL